MKIRPGRVLRLSLFTLTLIAIAVAVLPVGIAHIYVQSLVNRPCGNRPEALTERLSQPQNLEHLSLSPPDEPKIKLDAWFAAGENGAGIVILSGSWGGHNTMYQEMEMLHQAGYSVLTFDTRSCADPPATTSLGYREIADLQVALDYLSQRPEVDPQRIGALGHSMGGAIALMTAAQDERLQAVVASGNYADLAYDVRRDDKHLFGWWLRSWIERFYESETGVDIDLVSPLKHIHQISPRPILLIHGSLELAETRGLEQFEAAGEPKELWIVEGVGHGGYLDHDFQGYENRVLAFFEGVLLDD